jgi:predicted transposase/invertase (TIGR01784 family)
MRTDTIFFQLFQTFDTLLFELVGLQPESSQDYQFTSAEIKEKAFRIDGLFFPKSTDQVIWFVEVQFQRKQGFYWEFYGEIFLYLSQYKPQQDWRAAAIFPKRSIEPDLPIQYRELFESGRIERIYLDELTQELPPNTSLTLGMVKLVIASEDEAVDLARNLVSQVQPADREKVIEFIETVLVYKFPLMSRDEVQAMFTLGDLKKTRVYQEALEEGRQEGEKLGEERGEKRGEKRGQVTIILRLLTRRFGVVSPPIAAKIEKLTSARLEKLAEGVLDFEHPSDLEAWLKRR